MRYLLRRLGHAFFLLIGASILAFLFTRLAPGNYFDEMRLNPQIAPETVAALRAQYQLDRPLPLRMRRGSTPFCTAKWVFPSLTTVP